MDEDMLKKAVGSMRANKAILGKLLWAYGEGNEKDRALVVPTLNVQNKKGRTPLHLMALAAFCLSPDLFAKMLADGADPRLADRDGNLPADYAREMAGNDEVVAMLTAKAQELDLRDRAAARLAGADIGRGGGL